MSSNIKGGRRPVVYWAVCPECLTYLWVGESSIDEEETLKCQYCEAPISLLGGNRLVESCNQLQGLLEDIERQLSTLPTAIDVHRFISEQVGHIASSFNDRLDEIQAVKDLEEADVETKKAS